MGELPGRELLQQWQRAKTTNFWASNPNLQVLVRLLAPGGDAEAGAIASRLEPFGAVMAGAVDSLVMEAERIENLPRLRSWSGLGERIEHVDLGAACREAGRLIWPHGVLAVQAERGRSLEQSALIYLLCHQGEGGHACPVACTSGLIKALQVHGSDHLKQVFLPRLLVRDYDRAHMGSQFLTEVQGGSDVGANAVVARPCDDHPGRWRITGEKWFCSVANADQFFVTARVDGAGPGTAGLGAFLVPRLEDGRPNGFRLRRLKNKLGTRVMASAEIDFDGALAWPVGDPSDGFRIAAGLVLNTSRWINALGSTGVMRRAYLEASSYAVARQAFGAPIARYPMVRETLAAMKVEEHAALSSTLYLGTLIDRIEAGTADEGTQAVYRFLVNANKYITSIAASEVTHGALEVLGGNGAIEDFSAVPRLLRDNFVFESWEGTHNVLALQVLRDSGRLGLLPHVEAAVDEWLGGLGDDRARAEAGAVREAMRDLGRRIERSLADPGHGRAHFRRQLTDLARVFQASRLLWEADRETALGDGRVKTAVAQAFVRRHLVPGYRPEADPDWAARVDAVLGDDVGPAA